MKNTKNKRNKEKNVKVEQNQRKIKKICEIQWKVEKIDENNWSKVFLKILGWILKNEAESDGMS